MPRLTKRERKHLAETNRILKKINNLDNKTVREMVSILQQTRQSIIARLSELSEDEYAFHNLGQIRDSLSDAIYDFRTNYTGLMNGRLDDAAELGVEFVDRPIIASEISMLGQPMLSRELVELSQLMSADLVTDITEDMRKRIDAAIRLGILGEESPQELIRKLSRDKQFRRGIFKSIKTRAEVITRTEINRTLNLATKLRQDAWAEKVPELKKYWLHTRDSRVRSTHSSVGTKTNPALGGKPIGIKDSFTVGGFKATGPHAPSLPAKESINCRCVSVTVYEELKK